MYQILLIIHACVSAGLIGLVLIQHGKGADMGAAFGGGASQTLFGSTGSANFLSRTTAILATVFFATSLALSYSATHQMKAQNAAYLPETTEQSAGMGQEENSSAPSDSDVPAVRKIKDK